MFKIISSLLISLIIFLIGDYLIFYIDYLSNFKTALFLLSSYIPIKGFILFIFTLMGIFTRDLLIGLRSIKGIKYIHFKNILFETAHSKSFYESLFYAPAIFVTFYLIAGDKPDTDYVTTLLFAYQNGFFWKTIRS